MFLFGQSFFVVVKQAHPSCSFHRLEFCCRRFSQIIELQFAQFEDQKEAGVIFSQATVLCCQPGLGKTSAAVTRITVLAFAPHWDSGTFAHFFSLGPDFTGRTVTAVPTIPTVHTEHVVDTVLTVDRLCRICDEKHTAFRI